MLRYGWEMIMQAAVLVGVHPAAEVKNFAVVGKAFTPAARNLTRPPSDASRRLSVRSVCRISCGHWLDGWTSVGPAPSLF
eukprot:scaffold16651_cov135-Isochrysis_galbana.AAC.3